MTLPRASEALTVFTRLALQRARRGRLVYLTAAILLLPAVAALVAMASDRAGATFFAEQLGVFIRFIVPFAMALHASATVAEEVQGKTITYLFARPIPRWTLPLGKYLGNTALNALLIVLAVAVVYLFSLLREPGELVSELGLLGRGLGACLLAVLHYGAVAAAFGTMVTGFPFAATLAFVLVVEVGFAFVPGWFKVTAMSVHLRAVAGIYEPQQSLFIADPELSWIISLPVVVAMTLVWLGIALAWVSSTEYRTDR